MIKCNQCYFSVSEKDINEILNKNELRDTLVRHLEDHGISLDDLICSNFERIKPGKKGVKVEL